MRCYTCSPDSERRHIGSVSRDLHHMPMSSCEIDLPVQDPDGSYIARWVLELAKLPKKYLHMPWKAPEGTLKTAGVSFGSSEGQYPCRITTEVMQVIFL